MEALGALAVAEQDILALRTAHENRARSPRAHLALPVRQDIFCGDGYRPFNVETALYFCG